MKKVEETPNEFIDRMLQTYELGFKSEVLYMLESYIKEHAIKLFISLGTNEKRATEIYELWKNKL